MEENKKNLSFLGPVGTYSEAAALEYKKDVHKLIPKSNLSFPEDIMSKFVPSPTIDSGLFENFWVKKTPKTEL